MAALRKSGLVFVVGWRFFLFLIVVLATYLNIGAEEPTVRFERISIEKGLSQSTISCILQDRKGFLWFGTEDGLNKYDGYSFTIYRPQPNNPNSLTNNSIWALVEDRQGDLWVGTYNGLNKIDGQTEKITRYLADLKTPSSLSHRFVRTLFEDRDGTLWIGTDEGGLNRFDRRNESFIHYKNNPQDPQSLSDDSVLAINEDRAGTLWIGTANGLNQFDRKAESFIRYVHQADNPSSLSGNTVNAILEDKEGALWIGTSNGLNKFDKSSGRFFVYAFNSQNPNSLADNDVRTIFEDRFGDLWVGTDQGLSHFDRSTESFRNYRNTPNDAQSLSVDGIRAILEDRAGSLWIGTYAGGINKLDRGIKKFVHYKRNPTDVNSLSNDIVVSFLEDKNGVLWIGTYGGGLNKFERQENRFTAYLHDPRNAGSLSNNRIRKIYEDRTGALWIGTYGGGLELFDPAKGLFRHYQNLPADAESLSDNRIRSLCEDHSGVLWIGTDGGGLNGFDRQSGKFIRYRNDPANPDSLSHNRIFSIMEDHRGQLWIATFGGGLDKFIPGEKKFYHYRNDLTRTNSLSHDYVISLYEDPSGILWIGTDGGGLNKFDPEKELFRAYTDAEGLPNNTIYGILQDSLGNFWLSHNKGLSRFDPRTERFKNYDEYDGLQGDEFNGNACLRSPRTGEMFFGGVNGFNVFIPEKIPENPHIPPIVITNFQIFNRSVPVGPDQTGRILLNKSISETDAIDLSYKDKVFSFEYTALNFISPEKNQYAYIMEGFEKSWNYVGPRRFVSYTSLPPGKKYVFRVKGSNNDEIWNEKGTALRIIVHPPFWKTWWFYLLVSGLVVTGALGVHQWRIRSLKEKKEELEKLVALRTQELREASLNDPLTGLRNRRFISEVLSNDIAAFISYKNYVLTNRSNRRREMIDQVFGIFILDIDHFKKVNDIYGHEAGDRVLVQLGKLLKTSIRQDDIIVRFGGEEFLVILKKTDPAYMSVFADKIRAKVEATPFTISAVGTQIQKTCSIGYVQFPFYETRPELMTFEKTEMMADLGLYYAKEHGRNKAVGIKASRNIPQPDQIDHLLSSLEDALKNDWVKLIL